MIKVDRTPNINVKLKSMVERRGGEREEKTTKLQHTLRLCSVQFQFSIGDLRLLAYCQPKELH